MSRIRTFAIAGAVALSLASVFTGIANARGGGGGGGGAGGPTDVPGVVETAPLTVAVPGRGRSSAGNATSATLEPCRFDYRYRIVVCERALYRR